MIKRILVGICGTPYSMVAIKRAVHLAERHEAILTAVTIINHERLAGLSSTSGTQHASPGKDGRSKVAGEKLDEIISNLKSACSVAGIRHTVELETGKPLDLFISSARYHDIMVLGLRGIFEHNFFNEEPKDTLARLVSAGVRPIIAVSDKFRPIQKVLIAYSGSMASAKTMKRFVQLQPWTDLELKIVKFQNSEDRARQLLRDAAEYCRSHGFNVVTEFNPGAPKDFLLPLATLWQADMIVMGNSARNLLIRKILGETSLHLIRNADRPLFLCQ
jgi:nucleotide-binding universal stress UspA family protein